MASQRNPAAGQTADGASEIVQVARLNTTEDKPLAENFQRLGDLTVAITAQLRRQRAASHLHRLGPRPLLEALNQVEAGGSVDDVLREYQRLDPTTVRAIGAHDFPSIPIHEVPR